MFGTLGLLAVLALIASSAAPAAGHAATAGAATTSGDLFGFSGIRQTGLPGPATSAGLIARAGGNTSRSVLHWQALEPARDVYHEARFASYERLYSALRAADIKPIFVLQFAPAWAREPGRAQACGAFDSCHFPPAREMLAEWREFVAEVVRRFPGVSIEVWNEPNYIGQWQSGVDPRRYAELLAEADAAATAVNPHTPVYAGGLGTAVKPASLRPSEFLTRAYAGQPSLAGHADALNLHLYPGRDLGPESTFEKALKNVRAVRDGAGDGSTPLLISELGASTTGTSALTPAEQADVLVRAVKRAQAMPDMLGVLVHTLVEPPLAPTDPERGFGALALLSGSQQLQPKPVYCAFLLAVGRTMIGCPPLPPPPDPPPAPPPAPVPGKPRATVRAPALLPAGGRPRRIDVRAVAPAAVPLIDVEVCLDSRSKLLQLRSPRCRMLGNVPAASSSRAPFRVKLRRRARNRRVQLVFVARATGGVDMVRTRLRGS